MPSPPTAAAQTQHKNLNTSLTNLGHQDVHGGHRLAVRVKLHIERLDVLRVVRHDARRVVNLSRPGSGVGVGG